MDRGEFQAKIEHLQKVLENAQQSLQFTNIPVYVIEHYIKEETGVTISWVTMGRE